MNLSSLIGSRIKDEQSRLGLSQAEAAEKTGISREMWGKYERGVAIPGGEVLFSFASLIMTGEHPAQATTSLSPREAALVDNFNNMVDEDKRAIERLADAVQKPHTQGMTGTK